MTNLDKVIYTSENNPPKEVSLYYPSLWLNL